MLSRSGDLGVFNWELIPKRAQDTLTAKELKKSSKPNCDKELNSFQQAIVKAWRKEKDQSTSKKTTYIENKWVLTGQIEANKIWG